MPHRIHDTADRRWACPGFYRMPETGDGGICRIKLPLGFVTPKQLRAVAEGARLYGNDIIEFTNRANLQIRGVLAENKSTLSALLADAGLGPSTTAQADDIRNVMINPTAGFDRTTLIDTFFYGAELLNLLQNNADYLTLSPKFGFYLDGGEETAFLKHANDIWLSACDHDHFVFGFASSPESLSGHTACGKIAKDDALSFIKVCLDLLLKFQHQKPEISRFKHILQDMGRGDFVKALQETGLQIVSSEDFICRKTDPMALLGKNQQVQKNFYYLSVMPQLGRMPSEKADELAAIAETISHSEGLRLTPWHGFILPYGTEEQINIAYKALVDAGFILDPNHPYAKITICAGAPYCKSGQSDVQRDAHELAQLCAGHDFTMVHITGCPKSCATTNAYPATLVAQNDGRYDLYFEDKKGHEKFGTLSAQSITISEAADLLQKHAQLL